MMVIGSAWKAVRLIVGSGSVRFRRAPQVTFLLKYSQEEVMQRADKRKFHYIYKITRIHDGKFYIGMYSTNNLEDEYFGSGKRITRSIKKHGKEAHQKEILEYLPDRESLKAREMQIVNIELLEDKNCLNLKLGGGGGWDHLPAHMVRANAIANSGFINPSIEGMKRIQEARSRNGKITGKIVGPTTIKFATLAAMAKTACEKRRQTMNERGHQQGEKNSQFGTYWVTNGVKHVKIKKEELEEYLARGYSKGRKINGR